MPEKKDQEPEANNPETPEEVIPNPSPKFEGSATEPETNPAETQAPPVQPLAIPQIKPISSSEERTWAMLAHLSVLLNLVTGFLGGIAAIVIYFIYKDRSRLVAYHAMQSFIFQAITWLGAGMVSGLLIAVGSALGFLIIISLIYGVIGGVKVNNGEDFRYWLVGDWVRNILEPPTPLA